MIFKISVSLLLFLIQLLHVRKLELVVYIYIVCITYSEHILNST